MRIQFCSGVGTRLCATVCARTCKVVWSARVSRESPPSDLVVVPQAAVVDTHPVETTKTTKDLEQVLEPRASYARRPYLFTLFVIPTTANT